MNRKEKQKVKKFKRKLKSLHPSFKRKAAFSDEVVIYFDGGCNPNPGAGYGSYQIKVNGEVIRHTHMAFCGTCTNNTAELLAILHGLKDMWPNAEPASASLLIVGDSMLALNTISGAWKAKHKGIKPLVAKARAILDNVATFDTLWVPRKEMVSRFGH
jgi:ribonuclease HI